MNDYKNLDLWCQQAHIHVDQNDGDKLANLNDGKELVPYEASGFFGNLWGRKVERHTEQLKASCDNLTEEAHRIGAKMGILERIAVKPEGKDWNQLTIVELAESLDRLLLAPQVQLIKARGAFDEVCQECRRYLEGKLTELSRDQAITRFGQKLEEVFQQLNNSVDDPGNNLERLKKLLKNDVMQAFQKLGVPADHPEAADAQDMADQISVAFGTFVDNHQWQIQQHQIPNQQQAVSPVSAEGIKMRLREMVEDLNDDHKTGPELNKRIRELAKDTYQFVTAATDPRQALQIVKSNCLEGMRKVEAKEDALWHSTKPMQNAIKELDKYVASIKTGQRKPPSAQAGFSPGVSSAAKAPPVPKFTVSPELQEFMGNISDYASGATRDQSSAYCRRVWQNIQGYFISSRASPEVRQEELSTLKQFLLLQLKQSSKGFIEGNINEEIFIPLLRYQESLPQLPPVRSSPPSKVPQPPSAAVQKTNQRAAQPQPPLVTAEQLWREGLIANEAEYKELQGAVPQQRLSHQSIIPALRAFRKLQDFNPEINNKHFVSMIHHWSVEDFNRWIAVVNGASRAQDMMWPVSQAMMLFARVDKVPPELVDIIRFLDMNALSTPYLLKQLRTLAMCEAELSGLIEPLAIEDMAYLLNRNLLVPLHMDRMFNCRMNHGELLKKYHRLSDSIEMARKDSETRLQACNNPQTNEFLKAQNLRIYQVPPNGDCFFSAIGHHVKEPMRKVRQRCHWAAEDILAVQNKSYQRDENSPYDRRVRAAAQYINTGRLQRQVKEKLLLTPAFERADDKNQAWGEEEDLALCAVVYGVPFVPLSEVNGFKPVCGYGLSGKRYETFDFDNPGILKELVQAEKQQPVMLIATHDHWDPLVADR